MRFGGHRRDYFWVNAQNKQLVPLRRRNDARTSGWGASPHP